MVVTGGYERGREADREDVMEGEGGIVAVECRKEKELSKIDESFDPVNF